MKKLHKSILLALLIATAILGTSCRYDEGPGISIYSPEYRIIGSWQINHCYLNDTEVDSSAYTANNVGSYFYIYADYVLNVMTYYNGEIRQSTVGTWYLKNKYKQLEINFTLLGKRYSYTADVKKLTRKELNFEYDDVDGNHWRLEMGTRSSY